MEKNFLIAGFGGQGVLLAGEVLANAFMLMDKNVTWYPCYGAEMRGGTVNCEIVMSDDEVSSVNKAEADFIVVLNQASFDKFENKVKKGSSDNWTIELTKNPDILQSICANRKSDRPMIVGFAAESQNLLEYAKSKIKSKGCDFIIANDISKKNSGFASDYNEIFIIDKNLNTKFVEHSTKDAIAKVILENLFEQKLSDIKVGSCCSA